MFVWLLITTVIALILHKTGRHTANYCREFSTVTNAIHFNVDNNFQMLFLIPDYIFILAICKMKSSKRNGNSKVEMLKCKHFESLSTFNVVFCSCVVVNTMHSSKQWRYKINILTN